MRRMITNKQVVDIVNKGIEEGEIEASGLTPEQKEKLNNALTLPEEAPTEQQLVSINTSGKQNALNIGEGLTIENNQLKNNLNALTLPKSAPATQQLVGINTSGEQNALGIGDGLTIENNQLKSNLIYTIDFGKKISYTLTSDEIALFSSEARPQFIKVLYSDDDRFKAFNNMLFELNFNNKIENNNTGLWYSSSFNPNMDQSTGSYVGGTFEIRKINSQHIYGVTINLSNGECRFYEDAKNKLVTDIKLKDSLFLDVKKGFDSGSFPRSNMIFSNFASFTYSITIDSVDYRVLFTPKTVDTTNGKNYCYGEILTDTGVLKKYLLTIDFRADTYAFTEITQ